MSIAIIIFLSGRDLKIWPLKILPQRRPPSHIWPGFGVGGKGFSRITRKCLTAFQRDILNTHITKSAFLVAQHCKKENIPVARNKLFEDMYCLDYKFLTNLPVYTLLVYSCSIAIKIMWTQKCLISPRVRFSFLKISQQPFSDILQARVYQDDRLQSGVFTQCNITPYPFQGSSGCCSFIKLICREQEGGTW